MKISRLIVGLSMMVFLGEAHARHNCSGRVSGVHISSSGNVHVNVEGIGDGNALCSLEAKRGEYNPTSCNGVLSLVTAAMMSGNNVRLYFRNDTDTSCRKGSWKDFSGESYQLYHVKLEP